MGKLSSEGWFRVLAVTALLAGIIAVGVAILHVYRKRLEASEAGDGRDDLLSQIQAAFDAGEIDEAEFRRVRDLLVRRMTAARGRDAVPSSDVSGPPSPGEAPADATGTGEAAPPA